MNSYTYITTIGNITITSNEDDLITNIDLGEDIPNTKETPNIIKAIKQINQYLNGDRKVFDLPLYTNGTEYQEKTWKALKEIPYGQVRTYKEVATLTGNPNASRAVGGCCNKNPILIVIPCHRVIGSNHKLTGYAYGIDLKETLLKLETLNSKGGQ